MYLKCILAWGLKTKITLGKILQFWAKICDYNAQNDKHCIVYRMAIQRCRYTVRVGI